MEGKFSSEESEFDIKQLDHIFTLCDLPESNLEEDKIEILPDSFLEEMNLDRPLSLNKLFVDEDLYLGDSSSAGLDSYTLPTLFIQNKQQETNNSELTLQRVKELLRSEDSLNDLSLCICKRANLSPELLLTLPKNSPLVSLVPSDYKSTIAEVLRETLRLSLRTIQDAIVEEQNNPIAEPQLEKNELCRSESMSDVNSCFARKVHKKWTKSEESELTETLNKFGINNIPEEVWNELSVKFNRTICSLHAKAKSMQRPAVSKEAKTYYEMITNILTYLPNQIATKQEIIALICSTYHADRSEVERGVMQCLSKKFERIPGVYRLKEGVSLAKETAKSVKDRLAHILNVLGGEGTLAEIRCKYQEEFKDDLDMKVSVSSNQAVWEKTISKTLLKCVEFDKSKAKAKYTFKKAV